LKPGQKAPAKPAVSALPLVNTHPVDFTFTAEPAAVPRIVNALTSNKEQFFIIRYVNIRNLVTTSPPRNAGAPPSTVGETPDQGTPPEGTPPTALPETTKPANPIILGQENVEVTLRVEIVDFARPSAATDTKSASGNRISPK
jgi:hypothetical protein